VDLQGYGWPGLARRVETNEASGGAPTWFRSHERVEGAGYPYAGLPIQETRTVEIEPGQHAATPLDRIQPIGSLRSGLISAVELRQRVDHNTSLG
jgi:hypothetical protein